MKSQFKQIVSLILSVIMVLSVFTIIPLTVSAEGNENGGTIEEYKEYEILQSNAKSNSEQYKNNLTGNDGPAPWAFDDDTTHWWHTRYTNSSGGGVQRDGNKIGDTNYDDLSRTGPTPSRDNPIWIQTGFVTTDVDDSEEVAGISYRTRTDDPSGNVAGAIKEFQVWVSNYEDMKIENGVPNYTIAIINGSDTAEFTKQSAEDEYVQFDEPIEGKYVRLVARTGWDDRNLAASRIRIYTVTENYHIGINAGTGVEKVTITSPMTEEEGSGVYYLPGSETTIIVESDEHKTFNVTVTATPKIKWLKFDGWYNGNDKITVQNETVNESDGTRSLTFSYNSSYKNIDLEARFFGLNGDPNETAPSGDLSSTDTLREVASKVLQDNAKASSEKYPEQNSDGTAIWAFDDEEHWWHTRYGANGQLRKGNEINGHNYDDVTKVNLNPTPDEPVWIQTGFGGEKKLIGGISYRGRSGINDSIENYQVWVSDVEDMKNENGTPNYIVAATGSFKRMTEESGDQFIGFDFPVECRYIRIVATSSHSNKNLAATRIRIYEYIGKEANIPVTISIDGAAGSLGSESIDIHLPALDSADHLTDAQKGDAVLAVSELMEKYYNTLAYDYTADKNKSHFETAENGESIKFVCVITSSPAKYTLTYNTSDSTEAEQIIGEAEYGKIFKLIDNNDEENNPDGYIYATDADGNTAYWYSGDELICTDSIFTLSATEHFTVTTNSASTNTDPSAYIPQPKVSKTVDATPKARIEIPVSFMNVMQYDPNEQNNHGMVMNPNVSEFGVVIYTGEDNKSSDDIANMLENGNKTNLTVSTAYLKGRTDGKTDAKLTNKGRYLHTLTTSKTIYNGKYIYAYIIIDGEAYVSNGRQLELPLS